MCCLCCGSQAGNHHPREELKEGRRERESGSDYQAGDQAELPEDRGIQHLMRELESAKEKLEDSQIQVDETKKLITELEIKVKVIPHKDHKETSNNPGVGKKLKLFI